MEELIAVNIVMADRTYRLKLKPADEEKVRHTAKLVNEKLLEYKTQFAGKDMQDYIAMVLIWLATDGVNSDANVEIVNLQKRMTKMEQLLDDAIAEGNE